MIAVLLALASCASVPDLYTADGERACDPRSAFYADADGDGAGNALTVYIGCEAPSGYVATAGDCDDTNAALTETCGDTGDTADSGSSDTADSADSGSTDSGDSADTADSGTTDSGDTADSGA